MRQKGRVIMITEINVKKIDQVFLEQVKKDHSALKSSKDDLKEVHLNFDSAKGSKEIALEVAQILHSDSSIIPVTNATGNLDVSATILVTAGFEGRRTSDPRATFIINDGQAYGQDSKPEDLEGIDYAVYDGLARMSGRKFTILKKMLEGGAFSSVVAKKCGIIDEVAGFKSAFRPQKSLKGRTRKKSVAKTEAVETPEHSENSEEMSDSKEVKPVTRTRKTPVKSESTDGVQRGRIK